MASDAREIPVARGAADAEPLGGQVAVRQMRPRHLDRVLAIEARTYPRPWPREVFAAELDRTGRRYLVASHRRRVVGYGGVLEQAGDVHITTVAVDPDLQGRGVAGRLVYELLLVARAMAAPGRGATLEVRAGNEVAQRLYASFGFAVEGRRPGYYADNGEDALIMWRHDLRGPDLLHTLESWATRLGLTPPRD